MVTWDLTTGTWEATQAQTVHFETYAMRPPERRQHRVMGYSCAARQLCIHTGATTEPRLVAVRDSLTPVPQKDVMLHMYTTA
jgi:hypothetical protein